MRTAGLSQATYYYAPAIAHLTDGTNMAFQWLIFKWLFEIINTIQIQAAVFNSLHTSIIM